MTIAEQTEAQRQIIFDKLGYAPTIPQDEVFKCLTRIILVAGGERSGKSTLGATKALLRIYLDKLIWLVGATYDATREEFRIICEGLDKLGWSYDASKRVDPGHIDIYGGLHIATKSAQDPRRLGMEAPDGIIGCESAQLDYETFLRLRGRVAEKRGWLFLTGTFEGSLGWYPELFTRWQAPNDEDAQSFSMPTWTNLPIFEGGEADPEILALKTASSKEWFDERYGGVPCPPAGRVFNEFSNKLHTGIGGEYEFDPASEVYIWIDPGYATAYAVEVAQKRGEDVYIVDEVFERSLVSSDIIKVCKQRPWWNKVISGAVDIAGTQHQAMPAVTEVWLKESGIHLHSKKIQIRDGIERVKTYLGVNPITGSPLLHINAKCKGLISEMGGCPNPITNQTAVFKWKMDKGSVVVGDVPEDRNNHAVKALWYGLIDLTGYSQSQLARPQIRFW